MVRSPIDLPGGAARGPSLPPASDRVRRQGASSTAPDYLVTAAGWVHRVGDAATALPFRVPQVGAGKASPCGRAVAGRGGGGVEEAGRDPGGLREGVVPIARGGGEFGDDVWGSRV